ncbi:hypothetical protein pb186bvf_009790 [Paramecium bursaria]
MLDDKTKISSISNIRRNVKCKKLNILQFQIKQSIQKNDTYPVQLHFVAFKLINYQILYVNFSLIIKIIAQQELDGNNKE